MRRNKYRNKFVELDGHKFHSIKERDYYCQLCLLEKAGEISELKLQPRFSFNGLRYVTNNGKHEKEITYTADFSYKDATDNLIVIDVKSAITKKNPAYRIKKALMLYFHGIRVIEI